MDTTTLQATCLTRTAIDALKKAYGECPNLPARQSIATAYAAITLLKSAICRSDEYDESIDEDFEPSEYCAAI
ncbi:hypothetical protein [Geobacter sp. SVR]|uniref:hypothetical protein n=1 Tax=Geobacter sp. SVR TaxID=2495594 RepID=UPI00143EFE33|nr:hypothetical protein [Geobacter sp. SVR]BCS52692.1 hypothetical protein GSVR_10000 [Geobacter sp. SVR]GCF86813.1 hypothetical protein GSbR_34130 [Geobacter sp. SVR]